ncbi:HNH endonuclease, partial [Amycolatopsis azurea]
LCRRDHRLKDEPGWTYHLTPDGTLTITTPTGQTYDSTPPPLHEPRTEATEEPPPF